MQKADASGRRLNRAHEFDLVKTQHRGAWMTNIDSVSSTWPLMMHGNADLYPAAPIKAPAWGRRDESHFRILYRPNPLIFIILNFAMCEVKNPLSSLDLVEGWLPKLACASVEWEQLKCWKMKVSLVCGTMGGTGVWGRKQGWMKREHSRKMEIDDSRRGKKVKWNDNFEEKEGVCTAVWGAAPNDKWA